MCRVFLKDETILWEHDIIIHKMMQRKGTVRINETGKIQDGTAGTGGGRTGDPHQ